jgi:hypothetical protein
MPIFRSYSYMDAGEIHMEQDNSREDVQGFTGVMIPKDGERRCS